MYSEPTLMNKYMDDIFYGLGALLIIAGAYCVLPVLSFFVAGAFCLHFSWLIGKAKANS